MRNFFCIGLGLLLSLSSFSQVEEKKITDYLNRLKSSVENIDYPTFRKDYFFTFEEIMNVISQNSSNELNALINSGEVNVIEVKMELESQCMQGFKSFFKNNALLFQKNKPQVEDVLTQKKSIDTDEIYSNGTAIDALIIYNSDTGRFYTFCHDLLEYEDVIRFGFFETKKIVDDEHYTTLIKNFQKGNMYELMNDTYEYHSDAVAIDSMTEVATAVDSAAATTPYVELEKKYVGDILGKEYRFMFTIANDFIQKVALINKDQTLKSIDSEYSYCSSSPLILLIDDKIIYLYPNTNGSFSGSVHLKDNNQVLQTVLLTPILE